MRGCRTATISSAHAMAAKTSAPASKRSSRSASRNGLGNKAGTKELRRCSATSACRPSWHPIPRLAKGTMLSRRQELDQQQLGQQEFDERAPERQSCTDKIMID